MNNKKIIWRIVHSIAIGVDVTNPIISYPSKNITLKYEDHKLRQIEHIIMTDNTYDASQSIDASKKQLAFFFELLRYLYGIDLPPISSTAQKVEPSTGIQFIGQASICINTRFTVVKSIILPDDQTLALYCDRLPVLITLANDAVKSDSKIHAIRNYYMICEDLFYEFDNNKWPREAKEIRWTRNFVSHAKLCNREPLNFIHAALGGNVNSFNPTDRSHINFVNRQYGNARRFIEAELDKRIHPINL
jgi:hypothetical protein